MDVLTDRQNQILQYLGDSMRQTGYPPTIREVARHFGFKSPKAVSDHLDALERKGYINREAGMARGLRVLKNEYESPIEDGGIPIVGDVAAGLPILAVENVLGSLSMDSAFGSGKLFAVRVRGNSMIDYGIFEGDHVIVRQSPVVENNAIAVIYIDGEATVKKLRKTSDGFLLIAGNSQFAPRFISPETPGFSVAGPVVGVVRKIK